jgi:hypothetical protein
MYLPLNERDNAAMSLSDDVNRIIRDAAATTSIGLAAAVYSQEGISDQATPREGETQIEALARVLETSRELILALIGGHHEALLLLAGEIDALRNARD